MNRTPLTLIEAMLNERPVIATAVGGVVDLLGGATDFGMTNAAFTVCERGVSVQADDANGFAVGLDQLINDRDLRVVIAERGRRFIEQHYSKERLLDDVGSLYRELVHAEAITVKDETTESGVLI